MWRILFSCDGVCFFGLVIFVLLTSLRAAFSTLCVTCIVRDFLGVRSSLFVWSSCLWCALFVACFVCVEASACFVCGVFCWRRSLTVVFNRLCRRFLYGTTVSLL